MIKLFF